MSDLIVTEGPHQWDIDVWWGEDWFDPIPPMIDPLTLESIDLTGVVLELFARPDFNHESRFIRLTSVGSAGILYDAPAVGLASIFYPLASVEANLPLTTVTPWKQFLRASYVDPALGSLKKHIWTGNLTVHPARISA